MTTFDQHKNFAISTVATAPVPALAGLTLIVAAAEGALFPAAPFNAVVFPANSAPTVANAEIVRVTSKGTGDNWTIVRTQEASAARSIQVGDRIMNSITVKALTDIEQALATAGGAVVLTAQPVLEPGVAGQVSRGRVLTLADFSTLLGLPTVPVGLFGLGDLTNLGTGGALTNKGAVTFGGGIMGAATEAAIFTGSTGQVLYIADTGAADPFRISYGSWGCWFRTAKRGTDQVMISKYLATGNQRSWYLGITGNSIQAIISVDGTGSGTSQVTCPTDVCDDRWHHVAVTYEGNVLNVYLDGVLEARGLFTNTTQTIFGGTGALNIGGFGADGATAATSPHYGRVQGAFVTSDILSAEQIRLLSAAKVAHTFGAVPISAKVAVRRQRKGAALTSAMFSTPPLHLYNFPAAALTDQGSLALALTNNGGAVSAPAPDGNQQGSFKFDGSTQSLSATDAGLPSGAAARTLGCWFKFAGVANGGLIAYGAAGGFELYISGAFVLGAYDGTNAINSTQLVNDGQEHFAVAVADGAAADGLKMKLYLDGRLVASGTAFANTVLVGANGFKIGKEFGGGGFGGAAIGRAFATGYAMGPDEVANLFAKGSQSLGVSPKNAGLHVEAMDAASVYLIADPASGVFSQDLLDLEVAA